MLDAASAMRSTIRPTNKTPQSITQRRSNAGAAPQVCASVCGLNESALHPRKHFTYSSTTTTTTCWVMRVICGWELWMYYYMYIEHWWKMRLRATCGALRSSKRICVCVCAHVLGGNICIYHQYAGGVGDYAVDIGLRAESREWVGRVVVCINFEILRDGRLCADLYRPPHIMIISAACDCQCPVCRVRRQLQSKATRDSRHSHNKHGPEVARVTLHIYANMMDCIAAHAERLCCGWAGSWDNPTPFHQPMWVCINVWS